MAYDIEKKSLEAHVEICAERYDNLERRLLHVEDRVCKIENHVVEIKESIQKSILQSQTSIAQADSGMSKTLIAIGTTIMGALIGGLVTLVVHIK